jgi:hypothetical protein
MTRAISIVLFCFVLGIFLTPTVASACGKSAGETTEHALHNSKAKTHSSIQTPGAEKTECCKNSHAHNSNDHHPCGGQCTHGCNCVSNTAFVGLVNSGFSIQKPIFPAKEMIVVDTTSNLSPGFHAIWQPPKIS